MRLIDGESVFVSGVTIDNYQAKEIVSTGRVLSGEHRLVQFSYGPRVLGEWESVHTTEAEALAACAARIRERARALDAKADELTARAVACGVGPANPE